MRSRLTPRRSWPKGETIVPLPKRTADVNGMITIIASRDAWPDSAKVEVALECLDVDDGQWKPIVGFVAAGGVVMDRKGRLITESFCGAGKMDHKTKQRLPFFRHVWPADAVTRLPKMQLRVNTSEAINSRIEVDW